MKEQLKKYLLDNMMELEVCVNELNSFNGCLDYLEYLAMDDFNDYFKYDTAIDIALAIQYGEFDINDDVFRVDNLGHLESADYYELEGMFRDNIDEIVDNIVEYMEDIPLPLGVAEIVY